MMIIIVYARFKNRSQKEREVYLIYKPYLFFLSVEAKRKNIYMLIRLVVVLL